MIAMTSLISTISHLSGPAVYPFWAISMQFCLAMITIPGSPYSAKDMLISSTIPSTTDQDECARICTISIALLGLLLFLQTISTLDTSKFLETVTLLPRLQNSILSIPG